MHVTVGFYSAFNCPAITDILHAHFMTSFPEISYFFDYNISLIFAARFFNIIATFTWNFMDILIIMMSIGISNRFKQLNRSLENKRGCFLTPHFWDQHRTYHREICMLTKKANRRIGFIILISVASDLFFICVQLLNSLE
jgi:gustatory receptor